MGISFYMLGLPCSRTSFRIGTVEWEPNNLILLQIFDKGLLMADLNCSLHFFNIFWFLRRQPSSGGAVVEPVVVNLIVILKKYT